MNINMMPYHWSRHLTIGLATGAATLVWWWVFLTLDVMAMPKIHLLLRQQFEGAWLLAGVAGAATFVSLYGESTLRREAIHWRVIWSVPAAFVAWLLTMIWVGLFEFITDLMHVKEVFGWETLAGDYGLVSIRYRLACWLGAGFIAGLCPLAVRVARTRKLGLYILDHLAGGMTAGLVGAAIWQFFSYYGLPLIGIPTDLYYAAGFACLAFGLVHGLLCWGVPDSLYRGWIRVLSSYRFGYRVPIEKPEGMTGERFIGHYPRGLDINLPVEKGVAELHISIAATGDEYAMRGLSQQPTNVKRFLESVDLRYDPKRPAPLETDLSQEDVITLGTGAAKTEVEFLLLPKDLN
jgi:hypothetical protein